MLGAESGAEEGVPGETAALQKTEDVHCATVPLDVQRLDLGSVVKHKHKGRVGVVTHIDSSSSTIYVTVRWEDETQSSICASALCLAEAAEVAAVSWTAGLAAAADPKRCDEEAERLKAKQDEAAHEASLFTMHKLVHALSGESSWASAFTGWSVWYAAMVVPVRMLWHLGQPATIGFALFAHRDDVSDAVFVLLSVRQGLHVMCVLACTWSKPAYLLVDVGASVRDTKGDEFFRGYTFLTMYVLAPEIFVMFTLSDHNLPEPAVLCSVFFDMCALAALGAGIAGNLPPMLVVSYGAAALGALWFVGVLALSRDHDLRKISLCCLVCVLLPAFMVPIALSAGGDGGASDDPLSGMRGAGSISETPDEGPGETLRWLVVAGAVTAVASCCIAGMARSTTVVGPNSRGNNSAFGRWINDVLFRGIAAVAAGCGLLAVVVLVVVAAVAVV